SEDDRDDVLCPSAAPLVGPPLGPAGDPRPPFRRRPRAGGDPTRRQSGRRLQGPALLALPGPRRPGPFAGYRLQRDPAAVHLGGLRAFAGGVRRGVPPRPAVDRRGGPAARALHDRRLPPGRILAIRLSRRRIGLPAVGALFAMLPLPAG